MTRHTTPAAIGPAGVPLSSWVDFAPPFGCSGCFPSKETIVVGDMAYCY